jgi:ribonuclease HII
MIMVNYLIGIDDAGRGPLMGPMLLAGVLIEADKEKELKNRGAKDSKLLSPKQRTELEQVLKKATINHRTFLVTPIEIDTGMGEGLNLNQVEALAAASIINQLTEKLSEDDKKTLKIILDCPSINTEGWKRQLLSYIKDKNLAKNIICEHKADFNHPVVSAASIIAKVTRDSEIEKIKEELQVNFGSGYPSDPKTREFLDKNVDNPKFKGIFRESWATFQEAKNKKLGIKENTKQKKLF